MSLGQRTAAFLGVLTLGAGLGSGGSPALAHDNDGIRSPYGYGSDRGFSSRPAPIRVVGPVAGEVCDPRPPHRAELDPREVLRTYNPRLPYSPAEQFGYREGRAYYETGFAPARPLSPAEARAFAAGQRRASEVPWQFDPAKQAGWREGVRFLETGRLPRRRLSPAEADGFRAALERAVGRRGDYR